MMSKSRKDLTPAEEEDFLIKFILAKVKKDIKRDKNPFTVQIGYNRNAENELDDIIDILATDKNGKSITHALNKTDRSKISELYLELKKEVIEAGKNLEGKTKKAILAIPRFINGIVGVGTLALGETIHFVGAALRIATKVVTLGKYGNLNSYQDASIDKATGQVTITGDRGENIISKIGMAISNIGTDRLISSVKHLVEDDNARVKKVEGARSFRKQMQNRNLIKVQHKWK